MSMFARGTPCVALVAVIFFFEVCLPGVATAETIAWTQWSSVTTGNPTGKAIGALTLPDSTSVAVTYTGEVAGNVGTSYWQPTSTWSPNAPSGSDGIKLVGPSTGNTIVFSEPVSNPVIAVLSLGGAGHTVSYTFDAPFEIISQGPTYAWGGTSTSLSQSGNTLVGNEGNGNIQFTGVFSSISWNVTGGETWHAFTVGVSTAPEPSAVALLCIGVFGLLVHRRRQRFA